MSAKVKQATADFPDAAAEPDGKGTTAPGREPPGREQLAVLETDKWGSSSTAVPNAAAPATGTTTAAPAGPPEGCCSSQTKLGVMCIHSGSERNYAVEMGDVRCQNR